MIKKISLENIEDFNKLGLLVNDRFDVLFKLDKLLLSSYDYIFGYFINNILIGFIHVTKLYEVVDIINIVVDARYREKGIATSLINYIIDLFDDVESIMLEVNEINLSALSLYKKNNFKIINKRLNYYGSNDALIMKRDV